MELTLTRSSVHAADDPDPVRPELPADAVLGDLVDWVVRHRYLPTAGLGGTWVLFLGSHREPTASRIPAAVIGWWSYEPSEVAYVLPAETRISGWSAAHLGRGGPGSATEIAAQWRR